MAGEGLPITLKRGFVIVTVVGMESMLGKLPLSYIHSSKELPSTSTTLVLGIRAQAL